MHEHARAQFYVTGSALLAAATTVESDDAESAAVLRSLSKRLLAAACAGQIPESLREPSSTDAHAPPVAQPSPFAARRLAREDPAPQALLRSSRP